MALMRPGGTISLLPPACSFRGDLVATQPDLVATQLPPRPARADVHGSVPSEGSAERVKANIREGPPKAALEVIICSRLFSPLFPC